MKQDQIRKAAAALALCAGLWAGVAQAADHRDSPGTVADPAADINDVYVFRSKAADAANTRRTVFVMTVLPLATPESRFSTDVTYTFWIREQGTTNRMDITCTVAQEAEDQTITCNGPNGSTDAVGFNAVEAGNGTTDAMRVFAGLRDDPFFFDLDAFKSVLETGNPAPLLDDQGTDFFTPLNTLVFVVDVKNEVFGAATKLEVYGFTVRQGLN
jgi:hypothetical protein